jgi:hypothetical protein
MPTIEMAEMPYGMHAPVAAYTVFYWLFFVQVAAAVAWLGYVAWHNRTAVPAAALGGSLTVAYFAPPVLNRLTLVWFPDNIPLTYITAFGMHDPLFDYLGYALFFGLGGYSCYRLIASGRGARAVYGAALVWGVADLAYELPFLHWGMYTYYGPQPFQILGFPIHWVLINAMVPVLTGTLMRLAVSGQIDRRRMLLRVAGCAPLSSFVTLGVAMPVAVALNARVPAVAVHFAALLSIAMAVGLIRYCAGCAQRIAQSAGLSEPRTRPACAPVDAGTT